jgi:hypothetical protein
VVASPAPPFRHDATMRDQFRPPAADAAHFVKTAIVVPDTNVLLGLYRLSPTARVDALNALQQVSDRLWLPHQVGVELYRNVDTVRADLLNVYATIRSEVEKLRAVANRFGEGRRHEDSRKAAAAVIGPAVDALLAELDGLRDSDPAILPDDNDPILLQIEALFDGKVGPAPDASTLRARAAEFVEHRVPNRIPPGYLDTATKPEPLRSAGDFLLWSELLDNAEQTGRPHLLVTDDQKADWYLRASGRTSGPCPELTQEFATRSSAGYHQMTLAHFVALAAEHLGATVDPTSVDEIQESAYESDMQALSAREASDRLRSAAYTSSFGMDLLAALRTSPVNPDVLSALSTNAVNASRLSALSTNAVGREFLSALSTNAVSREFLSALSTNVVGREFLSALSTNVVSREFLSALSTNAVNASRLSAAQAALARVELDPLVGSVLLRRQFEDPSSVGEDELPELGEPT